MRGLTEKGKSSRGGIIREQWKENIFRKLWNRAITGKNKKRRKETQNHAPDGCVAVA